MDGNTDKLIQSSRSFKLGKIEREFRFDADALYYRISDKTGERSVNLPYGQINVKNVQTVTYRNAVHRPPIFLLYFLTMLACTAFFMGMGYKPNSPAGYDFLAAAAAIAAVLFLRTSGENTYSILDSRQGKVHILKNAQHDEILRRLTERWRTELRTLHASINPLNSATNELMKFDNLYKNGVISEQEYLTAKEQLHRKVQQQSDPLLPGEKSLN